MSMRPDRLAPFFGRVAALPGRSEQAVLYVAHDLDTADRVRDAESTILPGLPSRPPDASVRTGSWS